MAKGLTEESRHELIGMMMAGKTVAEVSKVTGVSRTTLYLLLKKHKDRHGNLKRLKGQCRKATKVTKTNIERVRKRAKRNPFQSISGLARDMGMSTMSMWRLVTAAGFKSKTPLVKHDILPGQQGRRLERAKKLLEWREKVANRDKVIIWSDEKLFYVQTHVNKKNDRILMPVGCADPTLRIVRRRKNPSKVMVWGALWPPTAA